MEGMKDWVSQHQQHLAAIYHSAKQRLEACHDPNVADVLPSGMLMYQRNHP